MAECVVGRLVQLGDGGDADRAYDIAAKEVVIGRCVTPTPPAPRISLSVPRRENGDVSGVSGRQKTLQLFRGERKEMESVSHLTDSGHTSSAPPLPACLPCGCRQNGCDVHLKFAAISRRHATLQLQTSGAVRPPPSPHLSLFVAK
jgi:hypothetical protein